MLAARGDGILYLWYTPSNPFRYLDASDTAHDLLNEGGTGPQIFRLGAAVDVMLFHASSNSLILVTADEFSPCVETTGICAIKVPLTLDGTQVAGPLVAAEVDVSASFERTEGIGYGPGDTVFFIVDTNDNGQEPRMQLLDPSAMTLSTLASSGSYSGAAVISAGTYSGVASVGLLFDTFNDLIRAYILGESGSGTTFTTGLSDSGHSEAARMVEIWSAAPAAPALPRWMLPLLALLLASLALRALHPTRPA